jgi:hypothetical protein
MHLQYAVATTTCHTTAATLRQMLREAEAALQQGQRSSLAGPTLL